jgi:hypothetical protein
VISKLIFAKFKHFLNISLLYFFILNISVIFAQNSVIQNITIDNPFPYKCVEVQPSPIQAPINTKGFIKPSVTDYNTPPDAIFPVLIVYVQFAGETLQSNDRWPIGSPPLYFGKLLANNKKNPVNGNWWDTYSEENELISDYWLEQSRGRFHIIGEEVSVVLDHDYSYYQSNGGINRVNDDIYFKLSKLGINWSKFDKWKTVSTPGTMTVTYEPDGYIDMIYKVHRTHAPKIGMPAGGIAALGPSYVQGFDFLIDTLNNKKINGDYYYRGSVLTISPGYGGDESDNTYVQYSPMTKTGTASFTEHEHGHYIFGSGHTCYGKMSGSGADFGYDECLSPWETIFLGYLIPHKFDYITSEYNLGDFSSRNSNDTGEVLEVPLNTSLLGEVFLIANRRKVSVYDKIMWGDTAHGDPYRVINPEYGKGVYIYHAPSGVTYYPSYLDQECADGLFNWDFAGYRHPDWSNEQNVEYYIRTTVSYNNDQSLGSKLNADGKSIFNWFGIGKLHECIGCDGTDRIFSNNSDVWTSREFQGDRWDAWNVGYNEMFSPYSSPSTKTWANNNSGIFIWYYDNDPVTKKAKIKVFKTGLNGLSEDSILAKTPPSRPMGVTAVFTECINGFKYPKIYWLHNMEPDMINCTMPPFDKKFYNIYLAKSSNINIAPSPYAYIETVNISKDSVPYFIDYSHPVACTGGDTSVEVLRYAVTAVDAMGWQSVKSDFTPVICSAGVVTDYNTINTSPSSFSLMQNYPNPFNPVTKIKYTLPYSSFETGTFHVKLIVYNILGEEVKRLVDEFKPSGKYETEFNGNNIPSGVYFYVLETSGYRETKKMVLLK